MRVLDEVADAIRIARGGLTRRVVSSVVMEDLFGGPVTPRQWAAMQEHLGCPLPPLEFDRGQWFRAADFETVWDFAAYVAAHRPDWALPTELTAAAWRNAQIFAGVRAVVADSFRLPPERVTREFRLSELE